MFPNLNAVAKVYISGLAICRKIEGRWQVLFLHPSGTGHKLKFKVIKNNKQTGSPTTVVPLREISNRPRIEITLISHKPPDKPEHTNGNFGDINDMCWRIDLDDLHPEMKLESSQYRNTTYLSIPHAKFFTERRTRKAYRLIERGTGNIKLERRIGDVFGVELECTGNWEIRIRAYFRYLKHKSRM